jgi:hypothetical protein
MTEAERVITNLTPQQVESQATAFVDFRPLEHLPGELGYRTHARLEELLGTPVASVDAQPTAADERTGQRPGVALGGIVGREREFTQNLPKIEAAFAQAAETHGISAADVEDATVEILTASGMGRAMHRTLDRPLAGRSGLLHYIEEQSGNGVVIIKQGNIANWSGHRQQGVVELLGGLSARARGNVTNIFYAASARGYKGPTELWRPEVRPHVRTEEVDGKQVEITNLTEATAAEQIHMPQTRQILGALGMDALLDLVSVETTKGEDVVNALIEQHGDTMRDKVVVAVGNAPAGYTQLGLGLELARQLPGFDPTEQFVAMTNEVQVVPPRIFNLLSPAEKSRVQNGATGLNSINGWLSTIVNVNQYMADRG